MDPVRLDDPDDPRLAPYRRLRERGHRRDDDRFVAESYVAVRRLLQSGLRVESVLATDTLAARLSRGVPIGVPLLVVEASVLDSVVGFDFHRGCVACGVRPPTAPPSLGGLRSRQWLTIVVAEGVRDPANLGALVRNCRAFGVDLLVCDARAADPFSRRAIRASMGNVFTQPLALVPSCADAVDTLRRELGATIVAATVGPSALPLAAFPRPPRLALLVGSEGDGLSAALLARADAEITIPVAPEADSLNVAAATAVLLYGLATPAAT